MLGRIRKLNDPDAHWTGKEVRWIHGFKVRGVLGELKVEPNVKKSTIGRIINKSVAGNGTIPKNKKVWLGDFRIKTCCPRPHLPTPAVGVVICILEPFPVSSSCRTPPKNSTSLESPPFALFALPPVDSE